MKKSATKKKKKKKKERYKEKIGANWTHLCPLLSEPASIFTLNFSQNWGLFRIGHRPVFARISYSVLK